MAMSTIPKLSMSDIVRMRSPGRNRANVLSGMGRMTYLWRRPTPCG